MTAFSLVMLGKLVFLAVFVCFLLMLRFYVHKHLFAARKKLSEG